jgi:hypothetical protein
LIVRSVVQLIWGMAAGAAQSFEDVEVSIPANDSSEASFVSWTTGRIEIDAEIGVTVHLPAPLEPKRLGNLSRASAVPQDESGCSLDVKTGSDLYRIAFRSAADAKVVAELADKAMLKEFGLWEANSMARDEKTKALVQALHKSLAGRRPLFYDGVQLLGPDPQGDDGSEVLLGEGILGLFDPNWQSSQRNASKKHRRI